MNTNNIGEHLTELQKIDKDKIVQQIQNRTVSKHDVFDSNDHFDGFSDKHIAVTGSTNSGKTTTLNLLVCKGQLRIPKTIMIFLSSMAMQGDNGFYAAMAPFLIYQYRIQNKVDENPNIYVFQNTKAELEKCLETIRTSSTSERKLLILEDVRVAGDTIMKTMVQPFLLGAKNANCQVVFMDHNPRRDVVSYESCGYVIMCNPDQAVFNLVTSNTRATSAQDNRFRQLDSLEKKAVIYDKLSKNLYWAFAEMPLIKAY